LANFERGVYEPSDEVRVFDGSEEEDDIEGSRLPLLIVLALLVLAMFAGVVWLAYTQGVARGRGETPVLTAASGPERVAPQAAGNTVPYQGFKIYEQPAPSDDSADAAPAAPAVAAPAAPAVAPKPAPMQAVAPASPKPAPMQTAMAPAAASKPAPQPAPKTTALTQPAKPAPASTTAPPKSVAALIQQANSVPEPAKPAPATKPQTAKPSAAPPPITKPSAAAPAVGAATGAPRPLLVAAKPAPQAAAPIAAPAGSYVLQIGAYKSQADADTAWKSYKAKHAALLSGHSDNVQQVDLGEKGTWYRLRIEGFSDREVATALCDRLKADGGVCILGK
jgi:cell division protein FtsN